MRTGLKNSSVLATKVLRVSKSMALTYSHIDDASGEASALLLESVIIKFRKIRGSWNSKQNKRWMNLKQK